MLDTLTRRLSDYLIYVVEDYTSVDQRAVHRHSRALQESSKYPTPLFTEVCHFSQERDTSIRVCIPSGRKASASRRTYLMTHGE